MTAEPNSALEATGWLQKVGLFVGTVIAGAYGVWKAKHYKGRTTLHLAREDSLPRVITRKEWHDLRDRVNAHGFALKNVETDLELTKRLLNGHLEKAEEMMESFTRLETGFSEHVKRWEEVGVRAAEDRREMREDIRTVVSELRDLRREIK